MDKGRVFYVYEHWRPDRDECFYVGKGHGCRANDMRRGRNRHHKFIQDKLSRLGLCVEVRLIADNLSEKEAFLLEIARIAMWKADGADLANISNGGDGPTGVRHTEEWKRAISERLKGRTISEETRARISASLKGKRLGVPGHKHTDEAKQRISESHKGMKKSAEEIARMSAWRRANPTFKGKRHTAEAIARIKESNRGQVRSEETRAKMRKPKSEEHKRKLSEINKGKTHSDETRKLLSDIAKADWARRKAKVESN